jgi:hypothetical protein
MKKDMLHIVHAKSNKIKKTRAKSKTPTSTPKQSISAATPKVKKSVEISTETPQMLTRVAARKRTAIVKALEKDPSSVQIIKKNTVVTPVAKPKVQIVNVVPKVKLNKKDLRNRIVAPAAEPETKKVEKKQKDTVLKKATVGKKRATKKRTKSVG